MLEIHRARDFAIQLEWYMYIIPGQGLLRCGFRVQFGQPSFHLLGLGYDVVSRFVRQWHLVHFIEPRITSAVYEKGMKSATKKDSSQSLRLLIRGSLLFTRALLGASTRFAVNTYPPQAHNGIS